MVGGSLFLCFVTHFLSPLSEFVLSNFFSFLFSFSAHRKEIKKLTLKTFSSLQISTSSNFLIFLILEILKIFVNKFYV